MIDEFSIKTGNNLLIVDSLNYAFRYQHKGVKTFALGFLADIRAFANSFNADSVIILGDGGSYYRKALFPDYKKGRKKDRTEQEERDFAEFMEEYNKALVMAEEAYPVIKFRGVEADDIAAYIVKYYTGSYDQIWLLSTDKDWDLLVQDTVSRFSYVTRKEVTMGNFEDTYGYKQIDHISVKVLMGDSGDSIPGIVGVGEKRAVTFVNQIGSAYDIRAILPIPATNQYTKNLNNSGDLILLNYDLMDLLTTCEEALGKDNIQKVREIL